MARITLAPQARRATRTKDRDEGASLPAPRRFTMDEYYCMARAGILNDDRVELLEGEIIQMAPIGGRHAACVDRLAEWFIPRLLDKAIVRIQGPGRFSPRSELQPDLLLLRFRADRYESAHPGPADILLLIEVSDSTLRYDRNVKLPLYANTGVPEVWIIDVERQRVHVSRQLQDGAYGSVATMSRTGSLAPAAFPDLVLPVAQLLGQR